MKATLWVAGNDYEMPMTEVVPWLFGFRGVFDSISIGGASEVLPFGGARIDVSTATPATHGLNYIVEIYGVWQYIRESWVLPWTAGFAVRSGVDPDELCDPTASERARRVQSLMAGHQRGWFDYHGFFPAKAKDTTS